LARALKTARNRFGARADLADAVRFVAPAQEQLALATAGVLHGCPFVGRAETSRLDRRASAGERSPAREFWLLKDGGRRW